MSNSMVSGNFGYVVYIENKTNVTLKLSIIGESFALRNKDITMPHIPDLISPFLQDFSLPNFMIK